MEKHRIQLGAQLYDWIAVAVARIVGGFLSTFLPIGMDVPFPPLIRNALQGRGATKITYHAIRNSVFGAVASFLVWELYDPEASFSRKDPAAQVLVVSLIVGGAGVSIVNSLFRQAQLSATIDNLTRAISELLPTESSAREDTERR